MCPYLFCVSLQNGEPIMLFVVPCTGTESRNVTGQDTVKILLWKDIIAGPSTELFIYQDFMFCKFQQLELFLLTYGQLSHERRSLSSETIDTEQH